MKPPSLVELAAARRAEEQRELENQLHPAKERPSKRPRGLPRKKCARCGVPCNTSSRKRDPDLCMTCGDWKRRREKGGQEP